MKTLTTLAFGFALGAAAVYLHEPAPAAAAPQMIYELRTYTAHPGRLDDVNARFRNHTIKLFEKHGMKNIGYWTPADAPDSDRKLVYVIAHKSRDAAKKSWDAFRADPAWLKAKAESEAKGPIVEKVESMFLNPVDYSALQ